MRKSLFRFSRRLNNRLPHLYCWYLRGSLKQCGEAVRFGFPVRLDNPGGMSFGSNCFIYARTWLNCVTEWAGQTYNGEIHIGSNCGIAQGVQISAASRVTIEDGVAIAAGTVIVDHIHDHRHLDIAIFHAPISTPRPVRIGKGSFLGANCFVGPGVQIGEHVVVAANAVVVKNVPSYCVIAGNPGRIVRYYNPETGQPEKVERGARWSNRE